MIDARLAAPALAAWSTLAMILLPAVGSADPGQREAHALLAALALVIVVLAVMAVLRSPTVIAVGLAVLAACVVASLHAVALWSSPIADAASRGRSVTVEAVVEGEPRALRGPIWQAGPQGIVPLATTAIVVDDRRIAVRVPVTMACACGIEDIVVGSHVIVRGHLAVGRDVGSAATLRVDHDAPIRIVEPPGLVDAVANAMRTGLRAALTGIDPEPAALVAGLATGDVSRMPAVLAEQMKATGLSHLTAVSGANVAIVVACALGLAALVGLRIRARVPVALLSILGFVVLVRPGPSVVRAAAMGVVVVVSLLAGGRRAGPSILAVVVLLLALLAPALVLSWAFALSVAATLGILVGAARIPAWLPPRTPPAIALALAVTVAAQLFTLPLLLLMGASMSWVAVPANLLAEVAVAPVTVLGLLAALLAPVAMPVSVILAHVAAVPARLIVAVAGWAIDLPGAHASWPSGVAGIALLVGCLGAAPFARRHWRRPFTVAVAVVLALVLVDPPGSRAWPPPGWVIVACDVGQGDALVLHGTGDAVMVVDAGPDVASLSACLRDLHVMRIGLLVVTHFHADHVGGLAAAYTVPVDRVLVSPVDEPPDTFRAAERLLTEHADASPVAVAAPGMQLALPGIEATVLWPARRLDAGSVPNNASIVLHVIVRGVSILLSGDVEREAQAALARLPRPRIDVLKAPHHGSANLDAAFVRWAQAPVTLISVGRGNDYGHPAAAALQAWSTGILGRTDRDGAVAVVRRDERLAVVRRG